VQESVQEATVFRGQLKRQPITVRPETMLTKKKWKKKSIQDLDGSFVTIVEVQFCFSHGIQILTTF